jgi:hypothetical protein
MPNSPKKNANGKSKTITNKNSYRPTNDRLEILRVFHDARDYFTMLDFTMLDFTMLDEEWPHNMASFAR